MNRIILIGNGFDLAHGLKTSYADFLNWYWGKRVLELRTELSNVSSDKLCTLEINTDYFKTWHLYFCLHGHELKAMTGKEIVRRFSSDKTLFRVSKSGFFSRISSSDPQWSNIEYAYYRLLFPPAGNGPFPYDHNPSELNKQLGFVRNLLIEYLSTIQNGISEKLVINRLKQAMIEPFDKNAISVPDMGQNGELKMRFVKAEVNNLSVNPNRIMLLNFNYTNLADLYLPKANSYIVNHIHGTITKPNSVVFGYGDEMDSNFKTMLDKNDNEYLRFIKQYRYLETPKYRQILEFIEAYPYQVCIIGHSCGITDRTLLNTMFEHRNCVSIKPFFFVKEDGTDNYMELVQNISRNFTDMKLMRARVVDKTLCEPYVDLSITTSL
jgi:hypothetical protein